MTFAIGRVILALRKVVKRRPFIRNVRPQRLKIRPGNTAAAVEECANRQRQQPARTTCCDAPELNFTSSVPPVLLLLALLLG
ncbi:hypothetical protein LNP20_08625 [Klebsiella pneumoniae subsp. pneumoniae]|nr:hypothetical protein [Klebsiella pneumoniae subsp. pneumoniae]